MKDIIHLLVFSLLSIAASNAHDDQFVAAVYEHAFFEQSNPMFVRNRSEALKIVMLNMDVYETQIGRAKKHNASIIVFPEYGLTGFGHTRQSFKPFLEDIPDPRDTSVTPCDDTQTSQSKPILHRLSCLAKNHSIYLVANMGDIKYCKSTDPYCPKDGRYQFNTNVVFNDKGTLVARYHKQHPFMNEAKKVNRPRVPEYITFQTPFGKFGTMICFDIMFHDPAIPLVTKHKVDHIVFPTAWFDVMPLFPAIGFHGSWARGMNVNFLGANTHVPFLKSTGSGVYSPQGARAYYRSLLSLKGSLQIANISTKPLKVPKKTVPDKEDQKPKDITAGQEDAFYSQLFGDLFLFKELKNAQDSLQVCSTTGICCSLNYKMKEKRSDELFALGVFDGLHTREGTYYIRVCALVKCKGLDRRSCGQETFFSKTIFKSFKLKGQLGTKFVFPQVVGDNVTLLPGEWEHDSPPVTQLESKDGLSKGLVTAALFGRVYENDEKVVEENRSSSISVFVPGFVLFLFIATCFLD